MKSSFFSRRDIGGYPDWMMKEELQKAINNLNKPDITIIKPNNMSIRCKFKVESKTENHFTTGDNTFNITLQAVYGDSEENKKFWEFTPLGRLELSIINRNAADQLEHNKEYYIDMTPA